MKGQPLWWGQGWAQPSSFSAGVKFRYKYMVHTRYTYIRTCLYGEREREGGIPTGNMTSLVGRTDCYSLRAY